MHTKSGPDDQDARTENNWERGKVNADELVGLGVYFSLAYDGLWETHSAAPWENYKLCDWTRPQLRHTDDRFAAREAEEKGSRERPTT